MNYAVVDSPTGWTCSSDAGSNTGGNQSPNNNIDADTEISVTSHEISETVTDPDGTAWYDAGGNENGDDCAYIYGDSAGFQGTAGQLYNQTINGHHYFIQLEFSNRDFAKVPALSCIRANPSIRMKPASGPPGTAVTATGGGWATGETVHVTYLTKLSTPTTVAICSAVASGPGTLNAPAISPARQQPAQLASTRSPPRAPRRCDTRRQLSPEPDPRWPSIGTYPHRLRYGNSV